MVAGHPRALAPRMTDLHPEVIAVSRCRLGRRVKGIQTAVVVDHDVPRPFEIASIDHHIAGQDEPGTSIRPTPVQRRKPIRSTVIGIREPLGHRRLAKPVLQGRPAWERKRLP